jgi:cytolysin (calcineurin-like family phosphatase)
VGGVSAVVSIPSWLLAALLGASLATWAADHPQPAAKRNVTFLATSDVHYDAFENEDRNDRVRDTLAAMSTATNLTWPATLGGGAIESPRGVVVLGDVIDDGDRVLEGRHQTPVQYGFFEKDFGLDGTDGLLKFRVYETWGNHDGPPVGKEKFGFSFQQQLQRRNLLRQQKGWLANLSTNRLHYSWDWDDLHFVMLGIYPADDANQKWQKYSPVWHDPQGSLTFLKTDLASQVGTSGRPVVLMSHCGFDTDWWTTNEWNVVYDAVKPYNVVLYLYGHTGTGLRTWAPPGEARKLQCVNTGQTENGFFVVQVRGDTLRVAYRLKHWLVEKLPDGKQKRTWDKTWEWKYLLERPLQVGGAKS